MIDDHSFIVKIFWHILHDHIPHPWSYPIPKLNNLLTINKQQILLRQKSQFMVC